MAQKKLDVYKDAIDKLVDHKYGGFGWHSPTGIMSDMKNWLCVHTTYYRPRRTQDGQLYIPTTGMATGYKYPRATIHFTLNQIVTSHMSGNWDSQPVVVLAPYNDIVEKNGNPQMVATADTFFVPNPDTGLILPSSTHIIKPNNDTLFQIGDKVSTYKTDFFTNEEIEMILSFVEPDNRKKYQKYVDADFTEKEIQNLLAYEDEKVRQGYETAKDKRAFLRGLFDETRTVILTSFLREAVVRMTMEKMGFRYINSHEDKISGEVADTALAQGIDSTSGDKVHEGTLNKDCENIGLALLDYIHSLQTNDITEIYESACANSWFTGTLRDMLLGHTEPDVYQLYVNQLHKKIDSIKNYANFWQEDAAKLKNELAYADKLEKGGIVAYNANLDIVLRRNAARLNQEFAKAIEKLKQNPEYSLLQQMIKDLIKYGQIWHKTPTGWEKAEWDPQDNDFFMISGLSGREM